MLSSNEFVREEATKDPLVNGQQLIAPDCPGDSGKLTCSELNEESEFSFVSPAFPLFEERRALQQL